MPTKTIYQIGLTLINGVGCVLARQLLEAFHEPEAIFTEKRRLLEKVPGIGQALASEITRKEVLERAEKELEFLQKNRIHSFFFTDEDYPKRLRECPDAPILFYFKGNTDLNTKRILSIVGTRNATDYGRMLIDKLLKDLSDIYPDLLIISGLAYGIDIYAHRVALKEKLPTVAVLAHGLDRIYPPTHRNTAVEMLENGGLLTDFPGGTKPDKPNFVKRNRIIAGLSDATVVVQSAEKGGSLITADIAFSYGRDVFCFPGRTDDEGSKGCNKLIRMNKAGLITSARDLIEGLNWEVPGENKKEPEQIKIIFPEDSLHHRIVTLLQQQGEMQINQMALQLDLPVSQLSSLLFEMELDTIVKVLPGGTYKLMN